MRYKTLDGSALTLRAAPDAPPSITISTDAVDRMRDRVLQDGLTFPDRIPVLFGHDHFARPVGVSGRALITQAAHRTQASWRWIENDPDAAAVKNVFDQGGLAASVGMIVHAAEPNDVQGYDITQAEVVEFSLVSVPANPDCTRLLKAWGWTGPGGVDRPRVFGRGATVLTILDDTEAEPTVRVVDDGGEQRVAVPSPALFRQAMEQACVEIVGEVYRKMRGLVD